MATPSKCTLLDLVQAVSDYTTNDAEIVATVAYLINSGKVRLCGNLAGAKIDLSSLLSGFRLPGFRAVELRVHAWKRPCRDSSLIPV